MRSAPPLCRDGVTLDGVNSPNARPQTGVGSTAVVVAAYRAIATHHPHGLITDQYSVHFVQAVHGEIGFPTRIEQVPNGDDNPMWGRVGRYFTLRTRVFDLYFRAASTEGIDQFVILGSGLDTRAHRLEWPEGGVVFELDHGHVQDFRSEVLTSLTAAPRARMHRIGVDLREDWCTVLLPAGLNPRRRTAWLAERLLIYLSADVETQLMDQVGEAPHRVATLPRRPSTTPQLCAVT